MNVANCMFLTVEDTTTVLKFPNPPILVKLKETVLQVKTLFR